MRVLDISRRWRPAVEEVHLEGSGIRRHPVGHEQPLTIPAAYQAIRLISQALASLPVKVYRREADGNRTEQPSHAVARVLGGRPNPAMTPIVFRETLQAHCLGWGNAFARVRYSNRGDVAELIPVHPSQVRLHKDYQVGDPPVYVVHLGDGGQQEIPSTEMVHIPALGSMGVWGYSPIALFRGAFELAKETEEYGRAFFKNDASPGGVLTHPGILKDDAVNRLRERWRSMFAGGGRNKHKLAVLEEGMKYEPISLNPEDAQFLETRQFQLGDIARIYNVPPHMLGDLDRSTFSNIEHQGIEFVRYTLRPWAIRWEEELNRKLFSRMDMYVEFDFDGMLRGDTQSRFAAYSQAIQDGWMSRNEVRRKENLEVVDGLDSMLVPLNMGVATEDGAVQDPQAEPAPSEEEVVEGERGVDHVVCSLRPCLEDAVARVCRAAADKRQRAVKADRLDEFEARHVSGFPDAVHEAAMRPATAILAAAWPDATSVATEALSVRLRAIGKLSVQASEPHCEWIVNLIEGAILDIIKESGR